MQGLSFKAQNLWAKKSREGDLLWLPLAVHMADSAAVAKKLWNRWLSEGARSTIATGIKKNEAAKQLFVFLAAAHDLGKAIPSFQAKRSANIMLDREIEERIVASGLPMKPASFFSRSSKTPHALATQFLLETAGCDRRIAVILASHHGKPPNNAILASSSPDVYIENFYLSKSDKSLWNTVQHELISYALKLSGFFCINDLPVPTFTSQVLLSGLVIMVDWIASNEKHFPYMDLDDLLVPDINLRAKIAWGNLDFPYPWEADNSWMQSDLYKKRFVAIPNFIPNTVQTVVQQTASSVQIPGIFVLEAPMGIGKTEAALAAAEVFASKLKRKGVFFALPTQATSDGLFPRVLEWLKELDPDELHSIRLMHGKSEFNETYHNLLKADVNIYEDENSGVIVHSWFEGRKKAMLDDFVVGTIDQLLLAALKQKHAMLRHLGLANKVVIIDECHAYDAYMSQYLYMVLSWLGAYQVPVIVLSATLPAKKRMEFIDAYLNKNLTSSPQTDPLGRGETNSLDFGKLAMTYEYPLISFTDANSIKQIAIPQDKESHKVQLSYLPMEEVVEKLEELLADGGCAGIIVNTVRGAQELAKALSEHFGSEIVRLLHSRFLAPDRAEKEKELLMELGKPDKNPRRPVKRIVVGTQVLEQSLDLDFDVLITDICPMDLLLQRIGRMHRHKRTRPEKLRSAQCFITGIDKEGFEANTERIYSRYLLLRTKTRLPQCIMLPQDIPHLVQDVYSDKVDFIVLTDDYQGAAFEHEMLMKDKEKRARDFRIGPPWAESDLRGWLDTDVSDKSGEAAVRDSDETIEVLVLQKKGEKHYFLPWIENGRMLAQNEIPCYELAQALVRCSVKLPAVLCSPWIIDKTIEQLEKLCKKEFAEWQMSSWLTGELFLILDERFSATICDYQLTYDRDLGLLYERRELENA